LSQSGDLTTVGTTVDLGQLTLGPDFAGTFFFDNAVAWRDYTIGFDASLSGVAGFRVELLDPLSDGNDGFDPADQPAYVPAGYSTSNNQDKLSFAQDSGLQRSAIFAGGSSFATADESSHRGDILLFSGLSGVDNARVTFGIRDSLGGQSFLLRISAIAADVTHAPEPASMILIGTGLAGLAAARRHRRAAEVEPLAS
jgi:hypothetical protein